MSSPPPAPEKKTGGCVVIVGRPNVGKSALFNRIAGRRVAIVHEESGVTRDRISDMVSWFGRAFELVDTGGIEGRAVREAVDPIRQGILRQATSALNNAAVVVMVVDATAGIMSLDESVADLLRRSGRPVLLAVNKCDTQTSDALGDEFARLGFPILPISAIHNRGIDELMAAVLLELPPDAAPAVPAAGILRVTVVGRPNVGKSSFINRLLRNDRVIVADLPGTTRDSIDIPFDIGKGDAARHYILTDTAGIRQRSKVDTAVEKFSLIRAEESIKNSDVCVFIIDGPQGPTAQDKKIASLIFEHEKGCVVAVNKWDKLESMSSQDEYRAALLRALPFLGHVPILFMSALSGFNIRPVIETVDRVATQISTKLPTGPLNRVFGEAGKRAPPHLVGGRRLKIFYVVQAGVKPIRLILFVNEPDCMSNTYAAYLTGILRTRFGLEGAPIILIPRARVGNNKAGDRPH